MEPVAAAGSDSENAPDPELADDAASDGVFDPDPAADEEANELWPPEDDPTLDAALLATDTEGARDKGGL